MSGRLTGKQVAVIGAFHCEGVHFQHAYEVGSLIAKEGGTVITGGLSGVMEASCKGAKEAGGRTVGILPTSNKADANPYCDVIVTTGMGHARNVAVVSSADAVIAISGSYGTLSEIALALRFGKPIAGIKTWSLIDPQDGETVPMVCFETAAEAMDQIMEVLGV